MAREQIEVQVFFLHETPRALLVAKDDDEASPEVWLPKTWKGEELSWTMKGGWLTLFAPEDLLYEKGLI
jgi:hypothetical protein